MLTGDQLAPVMRIRDNVLSDHENHVSYKYTCCDLIDSIYDKIVSILQSAAEICVPQRRKKFYKFWWDEDLDYLKQASIDSNKLWKAAGKPRNGPIFDRRQSCRLLYRKRLREEQRNETLHYTNELHDALIAKNGAAFWKCWKSKFNSSSRCEQVDGCTDKETIANNFVNYFKEIYSCNNLSRAQELENEYNELRASYSGLPLPCELKFDTELVSSVLSKLKRGKAADFVSLSAEHLLFGHPVLPVVLSKLFNLILICNYIPQGFKVSYIVPIPKPKDIVSKSVSYENFRGIAISPIISKVFEHCFLSRFQSLLVTSSNQFSFKQGSGCNNCYLFFS